MKAVSKFLAGAAVVAAASVGFAAPAAAQYYPPYGGYERGLGNVIVGAVLDSILRGGYGGYGGYGRPGYGYGYVDERAAVDQCARATEARLNGGYGGAYGGQYGYGAAPIRVVQIDRLERTRNGNFRVYGQAGEAGYRGNYGGYNAPYGGGYYGNAAAPQYRFSCKVDRRNARVTDLDIDRNRFAGYRY